MASEDAVTGLSRLSNRFKAVADELLDDVGKALYAEMAIEMKESMRRTPVDTGAARASHTLVGPTIKGKEVNVSIEVGGAAAGYIVPLHERLDVYHKPPTQAKFLESTLRESGPYMSQRVGKRLQLERKMAKR